MSQCEHHDYTIVEDYIRGLQWSPAATDHEKSLVAGNIRGFYEHMRKSTLSQPIEPQGAVVDWPSIEVPSPVMGDSDSADFALASWV